MLLQGGGGCLLIGGCLLTITCMWWGTKDLCRMLVPKIKVSLTSLKSSIPPTTSKSENKIIHPPILSYVGHYDSKLYRVFLLILQNGVKVKLEVFKTEKMVPLWITHHVNNSG
ncbi:hypothetical protein MKX03_030973 [Papaver bracteatum]|nr:hypothetical protein MKX03_030973 [Papaver bracteatum]